LTLIVATQDWHPADHGSFAANHPGRRVFEQIELDGLHANPVAGALRAEYTGGALFAPGLETRTDRARLHEGA
jgi:nicotinamidase/pyrazinamidase